jgi:RHS repeat-associated protein
VRQAADGTGAVTAARAWTPYGVELGGAQAGLGYTGEWWDAGLEMQYLRARWYVPYLSQFVRQDPMGPDYRNPQSVNRYTYALGNPTNLIDPSGLLCEWPSNISGSDCHRFILELSSKILIGQLDCLSDEEIMRELAEYYSGLKTTYVVELEIADWRVIIGDIPAPYNPPIPHPFFRWPTPEHWPPDWRYDEDPSLIDLAAYGFKRQYWQNTHHYFADFYIAYEFGVVPEVMVNTLMEIYQHFGAGHPFVESFNDVKIGFVAAKHAQSVKDDGIKTLPALLYEEMCIKGWLELLREALLAKIW